LNFPLESIIDVLGQDSIRGVVVTMLSWRSTINVSTLSTSINHGGRHWPRLTPEPQIPTSDSDQTGHTFFLKNWGFLPFLIPCPCPQTVRFLAKGRNGVATRNGLLPSGHREQDREHGNRLPTTTHLRNCSPSSNVLTLQQFRLVLVSHTFPLWSVSAIT